MTDAEKVYSVVNVKLTPGERGALEKLARDDRRSLTAEIAALIAQEAHRREIPLEASA